jgi:predicted nicotinamide N-methyase
MLKKQTLKPKRISCSLYYTRMNYPVALITIQDHFTLYVPDQALVKKTYEQLLLKNNATPFPFWAKIWPAANAMTAFLKLEPHWIKGKRVLEIGAGIGVPSFMIADQALEIIISDHAPEAIELIEKNIQYLGLQNTKAMCLDWNDFPENINGETILLSDINYAPAEFESLVKLIKKFLTQGANIIIATPQRIMATPFAEAIQPFVKRTVLRMAEDSNQDDNFKQKIDISILILSN